jgi:hypothetical protein
MKRFEDIFHNRLRLSRAKECSACEYAHEIETIDQGQMPHCARGFQ